MTRRAVTLIETLAVCALLVGVMGTIAALLSSSLRVTDDMRRNIENNQRASQAADAWRTFANQTSPSSWHAGGPTFQANAYAASIHETHLILTGPDQTRKILLPTAANATFTLETPPDLAPCAVLHLTWPLNQRRTEQKTGLRVVATGDTR